VTITSLIDSVHGDLDGQGDCSIPQNLAAGGSYQCVFTATVSGNAGYSEIDAVTAFGEDNDNNSVSSSDLAIVTITDLPASISVTKSANPISLPEPGGTVTFTVRVDNNSVADAVTVNSLSDSIHGNLNGRGNCSVGQSIAAGGFYRCSFTATVSGNAGFVHTNVVAVNVIDDDGFPASDNDDATVTITVSDTPLFVVYLPIIVKPEPTELSVFNDNTNGNVTFTVIGTGVSCTVSTGQTQLCGSFPPGTYDVYVVSICGPPVTFSKSYGSGPQTTRVFCK